MGAWCAEMINLSSDALQVLEGITK